LSAGDAPAEPHSPGELFRAFTVLALQGFGGVLPVAQRELVEKRRWLTREQFVELLSIGQVLPGPNIVNLSLMVGDRFFGWRGALAAVAGMLAAPLAVVMALALLYARFAPARCTAWPRWRPA
jgi:chromate transporter